MSIVTPWWSCGLAWVLFAGILSLSGCSDGSEPVQPGSLEVLTGSGQTAAAGTAVPIPPSVRLWTTDGKPLPGLQVTFAPSGGGVATPAQVVTNAQGVATLSSWTLPRRAGSHQLTASTAGVPAVVIEATATAGAAARLAHAAPGVQNGVVGTVLGAAPAVLVADPFDNPIAGVKVDFSPGGNGSVASTSAVSDENGIARSGGWTLGTQAGEQLLTATIADAPGVAPLVFVANADAAPAARLAMATEPGTTLGSGVPLQVQPIVEIRDVYGNRVNAAALPVTVTLAPGSPQTLSGTLTVLAAEGRAAFTDLVVSGTGNVQLRFSAGGLTEATSATFSVTAGAECAGAIRALDFALGESQRHLTSAQGAPFCFDFALGSNTGQQYLVQIENMSMPGSSDTGVFPGVAVSQTGMTVGVSTGAVPTADAQVVAPRVQVPERAVQSWDFGAGQVFEIEAREPAGGVSPALLKRGEVLFDGGGSAEVQVGDTIVVHMVGIPRLGIPDGPQSAVVRYTTPDLIIAEDVRLGLLTRQGGGINAPLSLADMEAIATDYARYAKAQADRFFNGRYNFAIESSGGRPIAIHSLTYADNIWGYTFPSGNYFIWDFWVGTNGSVKGPNQQIERNSNNLFMHEVAHMRHFGLIERANIAWRANRWLVEGFARATERWPVAMRLLGTVAPPRTDNIVLPLYPVASLNLAEDVPVYTQASVSMYGGYAASSYVFDYFADQVTRRTGADWTLPLTQFVVNAGSEAALNEIINRYLPGLDFGTLFTQARIALYLDDYAAGLPDWTQYHQFQLRASRTTATPQLDPRNLWPKIVPGQTFTDARSVLPGGAYGYIIDGTSATGSARVLFNLPRATYGVISVTRIK